MALGKVIAVTYLGLSAETVTACMSSKTEIALNYLKQGFSVIPLSPKSKIPPKDFQWAQFQKRRASEEEVIGWFFENPDYNLGIVTGKISNLVVVDIEKDGETKDYAPTAMVKSGGGGWHMYYRYPASSEVGCHGRFRELTDIKADGGYVVAPPSIHCDTGLPYEWIMPLDQVSLVELPEELQKELVNNRKSQSGDLAMIAQGVSGGERNEAATKFIGHFLAKSKEHEWETEIWPKVKEWNLKNNPPLEEKELRTVFDSIAKKETRKREAKEDEEAEGNCQIDILRRIIFDKANVEIFLDQLGEAYARVTVDGHHENLECYSRRFRSWLIREYIKFDNDIPRQENINKIITAVESEGDFSKKRKELSIRSAFSEGEIWYDLGNDEWQAVRIGSSGWVVTNEVPILFKRNIQDKQVIPQSGGDVKELLTFVNIQDEHQKILFLVSTITSFIPHISRPVQILYGPQGSAKSTATQVIKNIVDPAKVDLLIMNDDVRELTQQFDQHYLISFDNLSGIKGATSDVLCRAVTGGGFSKRKLYSNNENVIFKFKRAIVLNGVNLVANKPDLLDRSVLFELDRVDESQRRSDEDFWKDFNNVKPRILGGIFDVLSKTISSMPNVQLAKSPRMADFAKWGCVVAESLGYTKEQFFEAYSANMALQNKQAIDEDPLASAIVLLMENYTNWDDTASELLKKLKAVAMDEEIDIKSKMWPKSPSALSRRIGIVKTNLLAEGIKITKSGARAWSIEVLEKSRQCRNAEGNGLTEAQNSERQSDGTSNAVNVPLMDDGIKEEWEVPF